MVDHVALYDKTCQACSRLITTKYSTSFSMGIRAFHKRFRPPIYAIYGFVRLADEIVDTFHDYPQAELLARFRKDVRLAIDEKVSLNPVLHAFQQTVHAYAIEWHLIDAFLRSMEMDLHKQTFGQKLYREYIYGSAEVVGLMCLRVFTEGDETLYRGLESPARSLGSAFQKVNFLRDMQSDFHDRGRVYFPDIDFNAFSDADKRGIEDDINSDFDRAYKGILLLPEGVRFGVYLAYVYYVSLFQKIRNVPAGKVTRQRIRVNDGRKLVLLLGTALRNQLNLL